jgi:hypothetical protein
VSGTVIARKYRFLANTSFESILDNRKAAFDSAGVARIEKRGKVGVI